MQIAARTNNLRRSLRRGAARRDRGLHGNLRLGLNLVGGPPGRFRGCLGLHGHALGQVDVHHVGLDRRPARPGFERAAASGAGEARGQRVGVHQVSTVAVRTTDFDLHRAALRAGLNQRAGSTRRSFTRISK